MMIGVGSVKYSEAKITVYDLKNFTKIGFRIDMAKVFPTIVKQFPQKLLSPKS